MIGSRLGKWMIDEDLGQGGMGSVYLAHEVQADGAPVTPPRQAAVKVLSASLAQEVGFLDRFQREILALQKLKHPNIVQFYEAGQHAGSYFYVMEYVEGPRFDDLLKEFGKLPWDEVLTLAVQICAALKHAHDHGIIHRDIKPTNLILGKDGLVKLLDFGVAKVFANSPLTATHAVVGTADFMSPEQAAGKAITKRSDLYSLGVVMYKLLTGRAPFQAKDALEMMHKHRYARFDAPNLIVPEIPHACNDIICKLLEKEPEKRPPDALVLSRELESIRRKAAPRSEVTTDMGAEDATVAEQSPEGRAAAGIGPATLMSQLVRKELEDLNREGPISRMLNRAWLLVLLLSLIIGLLIYGLWPKDADALLQDAEKLVAKSDWREALARLDKLDQKFPDHGYPERVAELRKQIADGQAQRLARWQTGAGTANPAVPTSEAERFYREALHDSQSGKVELARQKWQRVIDAFAGIESQQQWVQRAQEAIKRMEETDLNAVEEAIRRAKVEPPEQARRRLQALAELYGEREDAIAKTARAKIAEALHGVDSPKDASK
jgi:tRNA A-37 threonylcarbamoyl transferase component Bud32